MLYKQELVDALNKVAQIYIRLPTLHNHKGIVRERVFCYEFYHQMRLAFSLVHGVINAEITKAGYPGFNGENPDFVFHKPQSNDFNDLVCEVKGDIRKDGLTKDLNTLSNFVLNKCYKCGVLIIYGQTREYVLKYRKEIIASYTMLDCSDRIWLVTLP